MGAVLGDADVRSEGCVAEEVFAGVMGGSRGSAHCREDSRRELPSRAIIGFAEGRQIRVRCAGSQILPFGNSLVAYPVPRKSALQAAFAVPLSFDAVLRILPEMVLALYALLILVKPPFKSVPHSGFQASGLREVDTTATQTP